MAHLLEIAVLLNSVAFLLLIVCLIAAIRNKSIKSIATALNRATDDRAHPKIIAKLSVLAAEINAAEKKAEDALTTAKRNRTTANNRWAQDDKVAERAQREHEVRLAELDQRLAMQQQWAQASAPQPPQLGPFQQAFPQVPQPTNDGGGY